jgi:hypothetical protein
VIGRVHWNDTAEDRDKLMALANAVINNNPSYRTMALGSTQHLTEMGTRDISCGVKEAGA